MARNIAIFGSREVHEARRFVTGVTASQPVYKAADSAGNKEWLVDVYLSPTYNPEQTLLRDVPVSPYARSLVTDIRQPITLERSKQGSYTVVGRTKINAAGAGAEISDPTYHLVLHNYADLRARHVADLDYLLSPLQATPATELQSDPAQPLQVIRAFDAFGHQVLGPELPSQPSALLPQARRKIRTRHVVSQPAKLGPRGDPEAMDWGVSVLQPTIIRVVEQEVEV